MKNEKLCLIGCGWLGKPLAQHLIKSGFKVLATTVHDKSAEFKSLAIPYLQYDLAHTGSLPEDIHKSDILIYTIPPLDFAIVKNFFDKIPEDKKIIFTSSTSVYAKDMGIVDENTVTNLTHTSSPVLIQTEDYLRSRFSHLTIIRPGGLYGEKRHPVFFLQGKKNLMTGFELLHLVHQQDCINAITAILNKNIWNETFNLVSDLRVPKKDYYTLMAAKLGLTPPEYDENDNSLKQTNISNEKSKLILQIKYLDPTQF